MTKKNRVEKYNRRKRSRVSTYILAVYLFVLSVIDVVKHELNIFYLVCGVIPVASSFLSADSGISIISRVLGFLLGIVVLLISIITKGKIGNADAIVIGIIGICCGVGINCEVLTIACVMIVPYSIALLARGRLNKKTGVAFVPFLFFGYLLAGGII